MKRFRLALMIGMMAGIAAIAAVLARNSFGDRHADGIQETPIKTADKTSLSRADSGDSEMSSDPSTAKYNKLTPEEAYVILKKGTESPFIGEYTNTKTAGTYICRRCNAPLYESDDKFQSECGWPSFDDAIEGAVDRHPDPDGLRTEIVCHHCGGHLGHVFYGERYTSKNTRHCVNSVSMRFIPQGQPLPEVIQPEK
jgi:peptide-methionine (R)-S-oxide reductase